MLLLLLEPAEGACANVAEREAGGMTDGLALPGVEELALEARRQGRRLLLVLPVERMDAASELSLGTCRVEPNEGVVWLVGRREIVGMSWEMWMPVGDSTRPAPSSAWAGGDGGCGADIERSRFADWLWVAAELVGSGGGGGCAGVESREGSMMLSLLRRDLLDDSCRSALVGCSRPSSETEMVAARA